MNESEYLKKLKVFEGFADHMYLDSKGYVTIGTGIMLASADAAKSSGITFTNRETTKAATAEEIAADFDSVKKATKGMFPPSKYEKFTKLYASGGLDNVLKQSLNTAKNDAKSFFPNFNSLPESARWALVDMAYNLGGAGLKKFAKLKAALDKAVKSKKQEDFEAAAKESKRNGIQSSRNDAIYDWIAEGY